MTADAEDERMTALKRREERWADWMRAGIGGDDKAYRALLSEVAAQLRPIARGRFSALGFGDSDVEDVVQEALIALHLKRGTWDPERPVSPWIFAIARHKFLDAARKLGRGRSRTVAAPIEDWAELLAAPEEETRRNAGMLDAERLLDALPVGQRAAVLAMTVEGLSAREAAERTGSSEGALRVALHRGLARLRELASTE